MNWMNLWRSGRTPIRTGLLIWVILALTVTAWPALAQRDVELGRFEESACPMLLPGEVNITCGYLRVPEVHGDPDSHTIRLAVAILHSHSDQPQPDPVVHLHGGPGQGDLSRIFGYLNSPFLAERDYILIDQRGVGLSEPALTCPESTHAMVSNFSQAQSDDERIAADVAGAAACRDRLLSEGITLEAYNTLQSAADFEALRLALGYEQWNLHGHSYGVLLAQTIMRLYPEGIRSVILEAAMTFRMSAEENAMFGRALDEVFSGCGSDPACNATYPQLAEQFQTAFARLNAEPVTLRVETGRNAPLIDIQMDGQLFATTLFLQLYSPASIPYIPLMIAQTGAGNDHVMTIPVRGTVALLSGGIDFGLNRIVTCQDIAPFPPAAYTTNAAQDFPYLSGFKLFSSRALDQICETWGVPAARADFAEPVHSDIPTLLLHGQYDPSLTPEYDTQIAATLPNSYHYVVPNAGHLVVQVSPCAQQIVTAFVRDPSREPATGCLDEVLAPAWVLPGAIYATPAMVNLVRATMEPVNPLTLALVAISLLIFVAALFGAVRVKTQPPVIRGLLALVALLSLAILLTLIGVILTTLSNGTLIGFGIPGGVALIRFLPLVAGGVAIALAVMVILFRRRASGSVRNLVFTSVVALAGLVVNGWLLTLGFLP